MIDSKSSLTPVKRIGLVAHDHKKDDLVRWARYPDVKALLRIAVVWNVPVACNVATADFLISSPLMIEAYQRQPPDYQAYVMRLEALAEDRL